MSRLPVFALGLLLAAVPAAQDLRPLIVRVVDDKAEPVAAAEVHAHWNRHGIELGPTESASATTDVRGYCRLDLPRCGDVHAYALGPPDQEGTRAASALTLLAVGMPRAQLSLAGRSRQTQVTVTGLAAWQELGPFKLYVDLVPAVAAGLELELDAEGRATLPPLPAGRSPHLELLTRTGETLCHFPGRSGPALPVPAPFVLQVEVQNKDGTPVQGAAIRHRSAYRHHFVGHQILDTRSRFRLLGTTGPDGKVAVSVPSDRDPFGADSDLSLVLQASAKGHAPAFSGFDNGKPFVSGRCLDDGQRPTSLRFALDPSAPLHVALAPGLFRAGEPLRIQWISKIAQNSGWTHLPMSTVGTIDARGTVLCDLPLDAYDIRFAVAPRRPDGGSEPVPVALRGLPTLVAQHAACGAQLRPVRIAVRDGNGSPLPAAEVLVVTDLEASRQGAYQLALRTDATGRCEVLLAAPPVLFLVVQPAGYAYALLEGDEGEDPPGIELRLAPLDEVHGTVVDADDRPVADARIASHRFQYSHIGHVTAEDQALDAVAAIAQQRFLTTETAADGSFVLRLLVRPDRQIDAVASLRGRRSEPFRLDPAAGPVRLRLP